MARVFQLHGDEHQTAQALLPWYVNGSLDSEEHEQVRSHVDSCPQCRADVAWQERVRSAGADTVAQAGAPVPAIEVDQQWAMLSQQIARKPAAPARQRPARDWLSARWWPIALGVQSAAIALLAVVWVMFPAHDDSYRALGAGAPTTSANALIVFRAGATESDMRGALRANHAQVVGGPTVTDAWLLRMDPLTSDALERLRAQPAVVRVDSLEAQTR